MLFTNNLLSLTKNCQYSLQQKSDSLKPKSVIRPIWVKSRRYFFIKKEKVPFHSTLSIINPKTIKSLRIKLKPY